jgi:hypothetical protein
MRLEPALVTRDAHGDEPWIRIEPNRPYVAAVTAVTLALLILPIVFQNRLPTIVVMIAFFMLAFGGLRFVIMVGPARLLSRTWVSADDSGVAARNVHGVVRYPWERIVSVGWTHAGLAFARWTTVEVTPTLGSPDSPYGPINPHEIANLWFLSSSRRSRELGGEFLSVCRRYGARTRLSVGSEPLER